MCIPHSEHISVQSGHISRAQEPHVITAFHSAGLDSNTWFINGQKLKGDLGRYHVETTAEYMYLASKAITNLKSGNKAKIVVKNIGNPSNPSSTYCSGNLNNYLSVAKSIVKTANSKGKMPNTVSSKIGTIGYNPAVYAFARVVTFYGDNHRLPSYVEIKSVKTASKSSSLNSKNTIKDLTAYLKASKNCQVNSAKIKQLVTKLTSGLKSDAAKANAIYSYVRDTISYTFYYNTKHGATGTLKAKSGNCVGGRFLFLS